MSNIQQNLNAILTMGAVGRRSSAGYKNAVEGIEIEDRVSKAQKVVKRNNEVLDKVVPEGQPGGGVKQDIEKIRKNTSLTEEERLRQELEVYDDYAPEIEEQARAYETLMEHERHLRQNDPNYKESENDISEYGHEQKSFLEFFQGGRENAENRMAEIERDRETRRQSFAKKRADRKAQKKAEAEATLKAEMDTKIATEKAQKENLAKRIKDIEESGLVLPADVMMAIRGGKM